MDSKMYLLSSTTSRKKQGTVAGKERCQVENGEATRRKVDPLSQVCVREE